MSDAKDHAECLFKASGDIKDIYFEWTPELVKLRNNSRSIHPSIGPVEEINGLMRYVYQPDMILPDPADTQECQECLKWAGLFDEKAIEVIQKFRELYPDYQGPSCGYDEEYSWRGFNNITFPVIDRMLDLFLKGLDIDIEEHEYTHERYIKKGIQLGLRPEFAIFCGMHKDDPKATNWPEIFEEKWFVHWPDERMQNFIYSFWLRLQEFMTMRLIHERKAWEDDHGEWLVHEGETMDQAKARVDDKELQRLKQEATEKYEAQQEQQLQEHERQITEENARLAEEDRLETEAEMLKQRT